MRNFSLVVLVLVSSSAFANPKTWYEQRERGWFWHETEEEIIEVEKVEPELIIKSISEAPKEVPEEIELQPLNSAWLKANIDVLLQKAVDSGKTEDLAAYAYANRLMLDLGSRFSTRMAEYMELEQPLQESARRPFSQFALTEFSNDRRSTMTEILSAVREKSHLWFFYSSSCSYCLKQIPVLRMVKNMYNIKILAISMDGGTLPGIEDFEVVFDQGGVVSNKFKVSVTPTMFLVNNETEAILPLAQGMHALPELEDRILLVSKNEKLITEEQYALTKSVREINVFRNGDGEILAEKDKLENDAGYLADLLKQRLLEVPAFGVTKFKAAEKQDEPKNNSTPVTWQP